jgi:hypothetical protein
VAPLYCISHISANVRDGRPATCDDVVEAMDEEDPGITAPLPAAKLGGG